MTLEQLIARQDGVVSRAQARRLGVPARTISDRVASGRWRSLYPGVYLVEGHRRTDAGRVIAAWLWAGPRSTIAGPTAAYWHGMLDRRLPRADLTVPSTTKRKRPPGITVRRRDLDPADRVLVRGVATVSRGLAVLETAPVIHRGAQFLDRALQRHIGFDELYDAYTRSMGARGMRAAGALLVACADRADSAAERLQMRLLREAGLTGYARQHPFGAFLIDVAFPAARLAIEVDGWAWHKDAESFLNDRRKGNAVVGAGWTLLRFTWTDLTETPDDVVRQVRAALIRAAAIGA